MSRRMSDDDPRHGTTAGYNAHRAAHAAPCEPCKRANWWKKARDVQFITEGYDDADGLGEGRWMRADTWGVLEWVPIEAQKPRDISKCGTNAGYSRHRRNDEPACRACKDANAAVGRERKARKEAA
jgi:hypothetical protein